MEQNCYVDNVCMSFEELCFTASDEPLFGRAFDYAVIAVLADLDVYGVNVHVALFQ